MFGAKPVLTIIGNVMLVPPACIFVQKALYLQMILITILPVEVCIAFCAEYDKYHFNLHFLSRLEQS